MLFTDSDTGSDTAKQRSAQTIQLSQFMKVLCLVPFREMKKLVYFYQLQETTLPFLFILQGTLGFSRFATSVCLESFEPALAVSLSNVATTRGILSVTDPGVYFWSTLLNI